MVKFSEENKTEEPLIDKQGNIFNRNLIENTLITEDEKSKYILSFSREIYINELRYRDKIKKFKYDNLIYLISIEWYEKFKQYVKYKLIKRTSKHPEIYVSKPILYKIDNNLNPGKISNDILIIKNNENILFDENYLIIDNNKKNKIDYKIVPKETFDILNKEFGCDYIIKRKIKEDRIKKSKKYDIYSRKFSIVFLPIIDYMERNKDIDIFDIYFPDLLVDNEIYIYLANILNSPNNKKIKEKLGISMINKTILISFIKIYKLQNNCTLNNFKEYFYKNISKIKEGHRIPGYNFLEKISKQFQIQQLEYDTLIIEFSYNDDGEIFGNINTELDYNIEESIPKKKIVKNAITNNEEEVLDLDSSDDEKNNKSNNNTFSFNNISSYYAERRNNLKKLPLDKINNKKGLVGLNNIGNTCFMNTSLQCLSNCKLLTNYFLNDYYIPFINRNNPIGSKGKLVESYVELIKHLWYGNENSFEPYDFKETIGEIRTMFRGYQQHDTQEFLSFLLDELHEDLNKVLNKPYVSPNENFIFNNDIDEFKYHKKLFLARNQSLIVDLFYGMFKSTVFCPNEDCKNISNTFDPYAIISLPLNIKKNEEENINDENIIKKDINIYFVYDDLKMNILRFNVEINNKMSIRKFKEKINYILRCGINNFELYLINNNFPILINENQDKTIYEVLLNRNDIFLNQIPKNVFNNEENPDIKKNYDLITQNNDILYKRAKEFDEGKIEENFDHKENMTFDKNKFIRCVFYNFSYNIINLDEDEKKDYPPKNMIYIPKVFYFNIEWNNSEIFNFLINYNRCVYDEEENDENFKENYFKDYELNSEKINNIPNFKLTFSIHEQYKYPFVIMFLNFSKIFIEEDEIPIKDNEELLNEEIILISENKFTIREQIDIIKEKIKDTNEKISDYQLNFKLAWSFHCAERLYNLNTQEQINDESNYYNRIRENIPEIDLLDLLEKFGKLEQLTEDNKWFCPKCKIDQLAKKKIEIFTCPEILILHLKRFKNVSKLENLVKFPIENLDMGKYIIYNENTVNDNIYDLFAVGNHFGFLSGGHYIAYCKNFLDDKWYEFNDGYVEEIDENKIVSSSAYVLFYKRRNSYFENIEDLYKKTFELIDYENVIS